MIRSGFFDIHTVIPWWAHWVFKLILSSRCLEITQLDVFTKKQVHLFCGLHFQWRFNATIFLWFWKNVLLKISLHFLRFMLASPSNLSLNFFFTVFLLFLGRKHKWVLQERQVPRSAQSKIPNDVSCFWGKVKLTCYSPHDISYVILLHDKFVQFDWLRAVVFQLNLKYLHVKITNLFGVAVYCLHVCDIWHKDHLRYFKIVSQISHA